MKTKVILVFLLMLMVFSTSTSGQQTVEDWLSKGDYFYSQGKYDDAIHAFENATELNPKYAIAWYYKGFALEILGKHDASIQAFDKAIELNPNLATKRGKFGFIIKGEGFLCNQSFDDPIASISYTCCHGKLHSSWLDCCGEGACDHWDCCNGTCYNHSTSTCCNGTVYPYEGDCCGSWPAKLEMCPQGQKCCHEVTWVNMSNVERFICYDPNTSTCCGFTFYPWRGECCGQGSCREGERCCGDRCYDPKLYSCVESPNYI